MQHVVIVDDAETNLDILAAIVADLPGTSAHTFTSSRDAMAWSQEYRVDAFLLDYNMPAPNGLEMIRMLRANPRYRLSPIIVVTAEHEFGVRLEALAAGANDFLVRPIERREVLARMRTLLALQEARSGLIEHTVNLENSLQVEERRSRGQAERLATLWKVAYRTNDAGYEAALQAVLSEGAEAIRPGQSFFGSLMRVEGEDCVLIAAVRPESVALAAPAFVQPGNRIPLVAIPHHLALRSGLTLSWDDLANEPALAALPKVREFGVRAQICVPFTAGRTSYLLSFSSLEPTSDSFRSDDHAYVNLLAEFFATRIQRAEQARRLAHQADRLTTLLRVANAAYDPSDEDALQAVLSEGAAAIRPGRLYLGCLMRVEGDRCLILAAARPEEIARATPATAPVGSYVATAQMAERFALEAGTTRSWQDASNDPETAGLARVRELGERAMIATSFEVGRATYLLSYASQLPAAEPFDADDHAYVQLLADFFATRIQRAEHSDRLIHHMTHDTLTGLRNRTQFRLDARAQLALHGAGTAAIVSLDGFRAINEEYGHIIGDALLVEVGAALESGVGEVGVAGRLAGDTFGVFLNGVANAEDGRRRLSLLHDRFTRPFSTGDREGKEFIPLSATIGAAVSGDRNESFDQLLSHADTAVSAAKAGGRGHLEFYQPGMESEAGSHTRTATEISGAIERGEFELYYQPHLDLQTSIVSGAEALIRWNHPEHGLLLPDTFIPFAEQHGLVRAITRWVLAAALSASERLARLDPSFRLFFNLSAVDFTDAAIVDELRTAARRGTSLANLGVELTETVAMLDLGAATRTVRHLQALGVRVAIDDFGTGYSALTLLRRLPVDVIKIDRSYVSEVLHGERDAAVTATVIAGGLQLGYETVAEGVETAEQLEWLRGHGCRYVQGYHIAAPQPLDAFVAWLGARRPPVRVT